MMYGGMKNNFGMGCLLARKLVEKGVTCVEVDLGGWDNHARSSTPSAPATARASTRAWAALVKDLVDRGLWKNTVVLWMGEFGRTPRINQNDGRDHWARCWSVALGGGAIKGGQVYGATSKDGMDVKDKPGQPRRPVRHGLQGHGPRPEHADPRQPRPAAGDRRRQAARGPRVILGAAMNVKRPASLGGRGSFCALTLCGSACSVSRDAPAKRSGRALRWRVAANRTASAIQG